MDYIKDISPEISSSSAKFSCKYYDTDEFNSVIGENKCLSMIHFNVKMLSKNRGNLIAFLSLCQQPPDVLMLTEIGKDGNRYLYHCFPEYEIFFDLPNSNKYGGAAILVKQGLGSTIERQDLKIQKECTWHECEFENIWIELIIGSKHYNIGSLYRHPNGNVQHFVQQLNISLTKIPNSCTGIIVGDINIDLIQFDNIHVNEYITQLLSHGFEPKITLPTRITDHSKTLIDHIFMRFPRKHSNNVAIAGNLYSDISDHLPVFLGIADVKRSNTARPSIRIYNEKNINNFQSNLSQIDWEVLINSQSTTDSKYQLFAKTLIECFYRSFPLVKLSRKRAKDKKWITPELKVRIRHKQRLHKKMKNMPSPENQIVYKNYKRNLDSCTKLAKELYYKNLFQDNKNATIKMWRTLGSILNPNKKAKHNQIVELKINNVSVTGDYEIANAMNKYFCNVGKNLADELPAGKDFHNYLKPPVQESIFLYPATEQEISDEIKKLNPRKSPGHDCISSKIIQACEPIITKPLTLIFNHSLESSSYPSEMKLAKVLALHKKKEFCYPKHYRPISLLSCLDKLFEKLLYRRFIKFIEKHNLIILEQYGFLKKHSKTLTLIDFVDKI
mgnify:CR=1 FL=1